MIYFIEPGSASDTQFDWFAPNTASGLTQAGLSRINQSIEAFVYCILGSQVNVRSSFLGSGGRAKEAQSEFLVLMEDAIRQPDLAKSVQRYQQAVDEAMVRLDLAICPGAWLMPAKMVINTESTVGYNNKLKQAVAGMRLGVNSEVNPGTKKVGLTLEGGPSKIKRPIGGSKPPPKTGPEPVASKAEPVHSPTETAHDNNKIWLISGLALTAFALSYAVS